MTRRLLLTTAIGAGASSAFAQTGGSGSNMFIGTYTKKSSKGIYAGRIDPQGKVGALALASESSNPSFLALGASNRLYAVNEGSHGTVSAFSFEGKSGALKLLNKVDSKGADPCHLALDHTGKWLFVANYSSGTVSAFPVQPDGSLGEASMVVQHRGKSVNPQRQSSAHAHMVLPSADNRFLFVPDLGLDQVMVYRIDAAKGTLTPNDPPFWKTEPGFGPRHLAFGSGSKFAYVVGEMAASVAVYRYDAKSGSGEALQTISMLPDDYKGVKSAAEIAVHPNGKFLYASNREHDSIAIFAIDGGTGKLTPVDRVPARVKTPRAFVIDPTGGFLLAAGQDSSTMAEFRLDTKTGKLTPLGEPFEALEAVSIVFTK
jgi:6-phosphogluconolactonase